MTPMAHHVNTETCTLAERVGYAMQLGDHGSEDSLLCLNPSSHTMDQVRTQTLPN